MTMAIVALLPGTLVAQTTLVSDNFDSLVNPGTGLRDASGKYSTGSTASTWWYENTNALSATAVSTPAATGSFSGNYMQVNFANGTGPSNLGVSTFAPVTLGIGDTLAVKFDFRYLSAPSSFDRNPQFGLYNGTAPTSDLAGTSSIIAGYNAQFTDAATDNVAMSRDTSGFFANNTSLGNAVDISGSPISGAYTATFRLAMVRQDATTINFNIYVNGTLVTSLADNAATNFTFNEFAIRARGTAQIDNFSVVTSVPEPETYALMIMGAAVLLVSMRRRALRLES